jgi:hypothetical protein
MYILHFLITVVLFVLLTPGILVRLPPKGSKWTVAIVHGIVFTVVMYIFCWYVLPNLLNLEGFQEGAVAKTRPTKTRPTKTRPTQNGLLPWKQPKSDKSVEPLMEPLIEDKHIPEVNALYKLSMY